MFYYLIISTVDMMNDLKLSHATIGVAPSQFTLDMREQIKHSKELRRQREKEEKIKKAKSYLISQITPKYTKNIIMKKIINYEVNYFLSTAKLPLQANDVAIVEKKIQNHLRPEYYIYIYCIIVV